MPVNQRRVCSVATDVRQKYPGPQDSSDGEVRLAIDRPSDLQTLRKRQRGRRHWARGMKTVVAATRPAQFENFRLGQLLACR